MLQTGNVYEENLTVDARLSVGMFVVVTNSSTLFVSPLTGEIEDNRR